MPPPKRASPARSRAAAADGEARAQEGSAASLREQLMRLLNPLDVVVLTRERLQEVVDDAVQRGRLTRSDAADLVTEIFVRGRRTTEDMLSEAARATGIGPAFPISGYENLTAAQVQARLRDLSPSQLRKVRDYERRNANRKTVLSAIESRLASS